MQKYELFAVYLHPNIITTTRYLLLNIMNLYKLDSVAISPSDVISLHKQDTWELTYVVHGRGTRTLGDETSEFSDGDLAFIPPHIPHCWTYDNHYTDECGRIEYATLSFKTEFIDRCASAFPEITERLEQLKSASSVITFSGKTLEEMTEMMLRMRTEKMSELLPYIFRIILLLSKHESDGIVIGRFAETDRTSDRINKVKEFSLENYASSITIDMIANHVGMNRSSFCTFFKKATGQTYITYLNKLRVDRACSLLRDGKLSITDVCYMVGFNDVPYFNRCFKNNRGMSPKEYADGVITQRQVIKSRKKKD